MSSPMEEMRHFDHSVCVLISGKRKSGKDYVLKLLETGLRSRAIEYTMIHVSFPIKSHFANVHGLCLDSLMTDGPYKEKYRKEMVIWGENKMKEDPHIFARQSLTNALTDGHIPKVLIVADARRPTDLFYFENLWGRSRCLFIRIESPISVRTERGWVFTKTIDDETTECGLDQISDWDSIVHNESTNDKHEDFVNSTLDRISILLSQGSPYCGVSAMGVKECISEEEATLYDRQIRLWGVEAQNRLKHARVILLGMNPLSAECAKNIVLAGVASLTIVDAQVTSEEDVLSNFLISCESIGQPRSVACVSRTQSLNPMVRVCAVTDYSEEELLAKMTDCDVVLLTSDGLKTDFDRWLTVSRLADKIIPTSLRPHLVCACTLSCAGIAFVDLGNHEFLEEKVILPKKRAATGASNSQSQQPTQSETTLVKKVAQYSRLHESLDLTWSSTRNLLPKHVSKGFFLMQVLRHCASTDLPLTTQFLQSIWSKVSQSLGVDPELLNEDELSSCCGSFVPAVNPILGGVISQEIVRAITGKGEPHGNWYFLNGLQCSVTVDWLPHSPFTV